jgi:hypothetical protein
MYVFADDFKKTCGWIEKLKDFKTHRQTCPFQQVQCPHLNCNKTMQRQKIADHEKMCKFKMVECEECRSVQIRHELQKHKENDCPEIMIPCPNKCTSKQDLELPSAFKR